MAKFHINAKTGEPGACQATQGKCPFGGASEHYTSKQAARDAFEGLEADNVLNSASKSKSVTFDEALVLLSDPKSPPMNLVVNSRPGEGIYFKITDALEGSKRVTLFASTMMVSDLALPYQDEGKLKYSFLEGLVSAETIVIEEAQAMEPSFTTIVEELAVSRSMHGKAFPALKNIVLIHSPELHARWPAANLGSTYPTITANV